MRSMLSRWLPVLLWLAVIYALSDIPSLRSTLPVSWDLVLRKFAHATEFGVLALLVWRASVWPRLPRLFFVVFFCFAVAGLDEYHQSLVAGRSASVLDAMVDGWGALLGALMSFLWNTKLTGRPLHR